MAVLALGWIVVSMAQEQVDVAQGPIAESLLNDGIHDPGTGYLHLLQDPQTVLKGFPVDRRGQPDWAEAIRSGHITPRADRSGLEEMTVLDLDIILSDTREMPHVRFPHDTHTRWLACENCHPAIFEPKVGANDITMDAILRGEFCGVCHGKVAFSNYICERCHSVPHEGSPEAWWQ